MNPMKIKCNIFDVGSKVKLLKAFIYRGKTHAMSRHINNSKYTIAMLSDGWFVFVLGKSNSMCKRKYDGNGKYKIEIDKLSRQRKKVRKCFSSLDT